MKSRLASFATLVCACSVAVACGSSSDSYGPPEAAAAPTGAALRFETRSAEQTLNGCVAGAPECTYVRFDHPNVVDPPEALRDGAQAVTEAVQGFLSQPFTPDEAPETPRAIFDRFISAAEASEDPHAWFLERKAFVLRSTPRIVSLGMAERSYMGGAHPLETYHFESFDITNGKKLSLSDVVPATKQEELRLLAERAFREVRGLEPEADLTGAGFEFEEDRFTLTDNFAIEDEGLSFYYNPSDIAPYSEGPTEIRLTYDELEGLLTPLVAEDR